MTNIPFNRILPIALDNEKYLWAWVIASLIGIPNNVTCTTVIYHDDDIEQSIAIRLGTTLNVNQAKIYFGFFVRCLHDLTTMPTKKEIWT